MTFCNSGPDIGGSIFLVENVTYHFSGSIVDLFDGLTYPDIFVIFDIY